MSGATGNTYYGYVSAPIAFYSLARLRGIAATPPPWKGLRMRLLRSIALLLLAAPQTALAGDLVVQLDRLRNTSGNVVVCVWNTGDAFPDCDAGKPLLRQVLDAATAAKTTITFKDIAPGTIAVSAFHDENANGKFDTNFIRMPLEGVGLSNNPKVFGPPKFKASTFTPKPGVTVRIKMSYL